MQKVQILPTKIYALFKSKKIACAQLSSEDGKEPTLTKSCMWGQNRSHCVLRAF